MSRLEKTMFDQKWIRRLSGNSSSTSGNRERARRPRGRKLRFESLELRNLPAANLAAIVGIVFNDLNGNGARDVGEAGIGGVQVSLTGNDDQGTINRGPAITTASGEYRFDSVRAGSYQVTRGALPAGYVQSPTVTQAVQVSAQDATGRQGTVIDTFDGVEQVITAEMPNPSPVSSGIVDNSAIGGNRSLFVQVTSSTGTAVLASNASFVPGVLLIDPGPSNRAHYLVTWDGDSNAAAFNPTGLRQNGRGVDLTDAGQNTGISLLMGVDKTGQVMRLRVYSSAGNFSEAVISLPNTGGTPDNTLYIPFQTGFSATAGSGANFADVGAIQLDIDATVIAMDGQFDMIAAVGPTVRSANFAATPALPAIHLEKFVNGQDADSSPGPQVAAGSQVTYTFTVTNTGNVALRDVVVVDDNATPANAADDFRPTFQSGDTNGNTQLDLTETWSYRSVGPAVSGAVLNTATVTAHDGASHVVNSTDVANYIGVASAIRLRKQINGQDADSAPGVTVTAGTNVTFTFLVTNPGNAPLSNIVLADNNGTAATNDDFSPTFASGDVNNNRQLDPNEVWTYTATRRAVSGPCVNQATVTSQDSLGQPLTATDPAYYFGVELTPQITPLGAPLSKRRLLASS